MTHQALAKIVARHGAATQTENRLELPATAELTLFVALADEALLVERVRTMELEDEYVVAHTSRGERFVVLYGDVRAVRFASSQASAGYAA